MTLTDVELSRALNAVSTTLRDQRPGAFDPARVEQIATGALAGEAKLTVRATSSTSGELRRCEDDRLAATVELRDGRWVLARELGVAEPSRSAPRPT